MTADVQWGTVSSYLPVLALVIAWMGLSTWRRQLRGTHDFELARRILQAVYMLRNAIDGVRHPYMAVEEAREMPEDASGPWQAYAYQARWDRVTAAQEELAVGLIEAEVVWDDLLVQDAVDLRSHVNKLSVTIRQYLRNLDKSHDEYQEPRTREDDAILYGGWDPDDDFTRKLNEVVKRFETKLKKKLKR